MRAFMMLVTMFLTCFGCIQGQTISLTFTATFSGAHQPLDSIHITNLTQGGDTTLYGTDTMLVLDHGTGTDGGMISHPGQLVLYPVTPNPVTQNATVRFFLPKESIVTLRAHDLPGREIASVRQWLTAGYHTFTFTPGREACYLLSVEAAGQHQVQKLVSLAGTGGNAMITYTGTQGGLNSMKVSLAGFPWTPGDPLRFVGYTATGVDTIDDNPGQSHAYTFQMISTVPPPTALFSASDTLIMVNDTVFFTDLSTGNPTAWKWHFGDGDSSMVMHPSHAYHSPGVYTVKLVVSNPGGADTMTRYYLITVGNGGSGNPCPGMPWVMDYNGNVYNTVQIGSQCWMRENLQARNYRNGTAIPLVSDNTTWAGLSTGARCWFYNDSTTYAATYGALYNWHAVDNSNGLCPHGWNVPTDAEWTILTDFLGGDIVAGGPLKETGTTHWISPNTGATNLSGFTALPGGFRGLCDNSTFYGFGTDGIWWSSSVAYQAGMAWYRELSYNNSNLIKSYHETTWGFSVRCVRTSTTPTITTDIISSIALFSALSGGNVTSDGGAPVTARGVCWSTASNPTIANNTTSNGTGTGTFTSNINSLVPSTTYYVRAYATNNAGTTYGNEVSLTTPAFPPTVPCPGMPTVTDYNGNIYNTVQIGTQCWMKENLKVRNYKNGTAIPNITVDSTWRFLSTGARCWYNNDSATYAATYGALYNWYAVDNSNGLCPTGWHVPTDAEWTILTDSLGGLYVAGGLLKETGTTHWFSPNTGATNLSGFTALPGGGRNIANGSFNAIKILSQWWSSTTIPPSSWSRSLSCYNSIVMSIDYHNFYGLSVRCVRD